MQISVHSYISTFPSAKSVQRNAVSKDTLPVQLLHILQDLGIEEEGLYFC